MIPTAAVATQDARRRRGRRGGAAMLLAVTTLGAAACGSSHTGPVLHYDGYTPSSPDACQRSGMLDIQVFDENGTAIGSVQNVQGESNLNSLGLQRCRYRVNLPVGKATQYRIAAYHHNAYGGTSTNSGSYVSRAELAAAGWVFPLPPGK